MEVEAIDERDTGWEVDDARFRVFVFDGANTTWAYDISGADVFEVARWAQERCAHGERYAIAVLHDTAQQGRGLIWLLGTDVNTGDTSEATTLRLERMSARVGRTIVLDE